MSAPMLPLLHINPALADAKKRRVLLVDSSRTKRDLRSETMRRLGADVDCAADISEARCWWRADLYDLVLMNVDEAKVQTDKFCDDIRRLMPQQQIMFLVGKPEYLAALPGSEARAFPEATAFPQEQETEPGVCDQPKTSRSDFSGNPAQSWGILEACRRISAVRSKIDARTRAMRDRPAPTRDSEMSRTQRGSDTEILLAERTKEETQ